MNTYVWISNMTFMNESRGTYEWVTWRIWMSHVARINESRGTNECCMWHTWIMSHTCVYVSHDPYVFHDMWPIWITWHICESCDPYESDDPYQWVMWHYNTTHVPYNSCPTLQTLPYPTPTNLPPSHTTYPCVMKKKSRLWLCIKLWVPSRREECIAPHKLATLGVVARSEKNDTYEWVMWRIWMTHVVHMNESCNTYVWVMWHSCDTCVWGMWLIWMSHVTHMSGSCDTFEWVIWHRWMSYMTHLNESRDTHEWVMWHMKEAHQRITHELVPLMTCVTRMNNDTNESYHTYASIMTHTRTRHVTYMITLSHTYPWVTPACHLWKRLF